jgi:hypothetical protein
MAQRLKSWESPRNEGRNNKGKGGSARQRQLKKRTQMLRQKLKDQGKGDNSGHGQPKKGENHDSLPFLLPHILQQLKNTLTERRSEGTNKGHPKQSTCRGALYESRSTLLLVL